MCLPLRSAASAEPSEGEQEGLFSLSNFSGFVCLFEAFLQCSVKHRGLAHSLDKDSQPGNHCLRRKKWISVVWAQGRCSDTWGPDFAAGLMKDLEQVTTHFYSAWRMGVTTASFTKIPQSMDEKCCSQVLMVGCPSFSPDLFLFTSFLPVSRVVEPSAFLLAYIEY